MQEKVTIAGISGLVFSLLGKIDWLVIFWSICMGLDYVSGTLAAIKRKEWSASCAASGIWKKVGSIFAVITGAVLDLLLYAVESKFPDIKFPFDYKPIFCCLVLVWYIVTELGSIIENAGRMGAPIPRFLHAHLESMKSSISDDDQKTRKINHGKKK